MSGYVHSFETMGLVDGPGVRVVVFMTGCQLRCLYCHNPEMWEMNEGHLMSADEVVYRISRYKHFFNNNEGGATFSGGEPLLQPEFLEECLRLCNERHIHTCLDTAGHGLGNYENILKYTDLVIFDIKGLDDNYEKITSQSIDESLKFLEVCQRLKKPLWLRQVIVPGINDNEEYIRKLKKFVNTLKYVERVEFLPYHLLGVSKYKNLNLPYSLDRVPSMNEERLAELYNLFLET